MQERQFDDLVSEYGELFVVLDSGIEYEIHGNRGYSTVTRSSDSTGVQTWVKAEGMMGDEYVDVEFPLDAVEHIRSHREL